MADFDPKSFLQKYSAPTALAPQSDPGQASAPQIQQSPVQGFDPQGFLNQYGAPQAPAAPPHWYDNPGEGLLRGIGTAAKAVDSVTGAPTRAAIYAAQGAPEGQGLSQAWSAAKNQFANMHQDAPSGKDIAAKAGFSTDPSSPRMSTLDDGPSGPAGDRMAMMKLGGDTSPAGLVGVGVDQVANPLNLVGPGLKAAGKVAEAAAPLADTLHEFATNRAIKAAGAMKKDFNLINEKGMQDALGSFLLDNKIVTPFSTVSKVADRLSDAKQAAGETVGQILDASDAANAPRISAKAIADKLSQDPEIQNLSRIPGGEGTAAQINKFIETLGSNGDSLTLRDAQSLRQGIDKSINYNKAVPDMRGAQPYLYKMRDALSTEMNNAVNALPGGGDADRLKDANAAYSKLATLDKIAQNRVGALSSNEKFSATDKLAGGLGMLLGHDPMSKAIIGAATAGSNKVGRSIGPGLMATGANTASKALSGAPEILAATPDAAGPVSTAVTQGLMSNVPRLSRAADTPPKKSIPSALNVGIDALNTLGKGDTVDSVANNPEARGIVKRMIEKFGDDAVSKINQEMPGLIQKIQDQPNINLEKRAPAAQ